MVLMVLQNNEKNLCNTGIVKEPAGVETSGQGDVLLVTQSAADIIGRVAGDATADAIFCERLALEVHRYRSQVYESHLHEKYCRNSQPYHCRLCPYGHVPFVTAYKAPLGEFASIPRASEDVLSDPITLPTPHGLP